MQPPNDEAPAARGRRVFPLPARPRGGALRHLIVTADDFGLAPEVNQAVEASHRDGILTAASLMVGAPAAADAIARARRLPTLRIGLHLVLVEGRPVLPPEDLPSLVDRTGQFRTDMVRVGIDIFARPAARRQIRAEIDAQFRAFQSSGLALDHVNAHKHFHLHPTIAHEIIAIGARYGLRGLRVPIEPRSVLAKVEGPQLHALPAVVAPWAKLLARNARRARLHSPDSVFGLAWSGAMTTSRLAGLMQNLPPGTTEIYMHPATRDGFAGHAPGYRYAEEFATLIAAPVIAAAHCADVSLGGYADINLR